MLGSYFMAAVWAAASFSRGGFSLCPAGNAWRVMVTDGSTFHLEPGTRPYYFCSVLQSGVTGGAPVWGGDMILVSSHGEADSGVHTGFLRQVMGKWARRQWGGTWQQEWA